MRVAAVLLLCLVATCLGAFEKLLQDRYSSDWVVKLRDGQSPASLNELGFEVIGKVADIHQTYSVRHKETHARHYVAGKRSVSFSPSHHVTSALEAHPIVLSAYQQKFLNYVPMQSPPITDPLYPQQWHLQNTGQFGATSGVDINVVSAWNQNITGRGILVTTIDDGTQYTHPDLASNYNSQWGKNYNGGSRGTNDPYPDIDEGDFHGTTTAGLTWAGARDGSCGAGVAYEATGTAVRIIGTGDTATDADSADSYTFSASVTDVYSNSYGFPVLGLFSPEISVVEQQALARTATQGRAGKGAVFVFSAGNEGEVNGNADLKGLTNNRYNLVVGSNDFNGKLSYFSDVGCNVLVTAPGSGSPDGSVGVLGTDIVGTDGYATTDCQTVFQGTSASCPVVSGVVALVLQANPNLSWRDVQYIIATTATVIDSTDSSWTTNAAGHRVSSRYGYGMVNAGAAVNAARTHTIFPAEVASTRSSNEVKRIPDDDANGVTYTFSVSQNMTVESAVLSFNIFHNHSNELQITLTSPAGTKSVFAYLRGGIVVATSSAFGNSLLPIGPALYGQQIKFDKTARITGTVRTVSATNCATLPSCAGLSGNIAFVSLSLTNAQAQECTSFVTLALAAQTCGATAAIFSFNTPNPTSYEPGLLFPYTFGVSSDVKIFVGYMQYTIAAQVRSSINGVQISLAGFIYPTNNYEFGWSCTTKRLMGELSLGTWTVQIADTFPTVTGSVNSVSLTVFGHYENGIPSTTGPSDTSATSFFTGSTMGLSTTGSSSSVAVSMLAVLFAALFVL